jgi:hypothetical protein
MGIICCIYYYFFLYSYAPNTDINHEKPKKICLVLCVFLFLCVFCKIMALITFPRLNRNGDLTTSNFCFWYLTVKVKYADADVFP